MKKIEGIILVILFGVIIICLVAITGNYFGLLEISSKKIVNLSLFGFLTSGFSIIIFPLWSVGSYLKTSSVKKILDYRMRHQMPYVGLTIGFLGLMVLLVAEKYSNNLLLSLLFCVIGGSSLLTGFVIFCLSFKDKKVTE